MSLNENNNTFVPPSPDLSQSSFPPLPFPNLLYPIGNNSGNDNSMDLDTSVGLRTGSVEGRGQETAPQNETLKPFDTTSPPRKQARKRYSKVASNYFSREFVSDNWQKYFIVTRKEGDFTNISPFHYCELIVKSIGKPKNVRRLGSGALNVEAANPDQVERLLQLKKLGDFEITVTPNKKLNTSQGVIVCRDFLVCSEEEIKKGLADQGVIEVRRINRRQGGTLTATASLVLTFNRPQPPEQVEAAFYKLKVRRYIPSPMRCFQCLKFGHMSLRCRAEGQVCICGVPVHEGKPCQDPPVCVNCAGAHNARSADCPTFKEEKEIQKVKTLQNMSYPEARALVRSNYYSKSDRSYASVIKETPMLERRNWERTIEPLLFRAPQAPQKPILTGREPSRTMVPINSKEAPISHPIPEAAVAIPPFGSRDILPVPSPKTVVLTPLVRRTAEAIEPVVPKPAGTTKEKRGAKKANVSTTEQKKLQLSGESVHKAPIIPNKEIDTNSEVASSSQLGKDPEPTSMNWGLQKERDGDGDVSESGDSSRTCVSDGGGRPPSSKEKKKKGRRIGKT